MRDGQVARISLYKGRSREPQAGAGMADEEQLAILKQGAHAWNAWRREHPDVVKPDLVGAPLTKAPLAGANLIAADLRLANLAGADLSGAILIAANLAGADLREATLPGADLHLLSWSIQT